MDDLSLEQAVDLLRQGVVVAISDAADGRLDASLAQPLSVFDRQVLRPAVGMMDEPCALDGAAIIDSLFEGIENETCVRCLARPPANDAARVSAWVDFVEPMGIKTVIFDEIQELRHGRSTDKGLAAHAFCEQAEYKLGLSATPIYNYGSEIFSVVEYIAPGALGSWGEFVVNWCTNVGSHWIVTEPEALGAYLQEEGIALRRTCADEEVASTLPPLSKTLIEVDWDDGAVQTDRELQVRLAQRVLNGRFHDSGTAARELNMLLRQETGLAKARSTVAYVRTLAEAGEPVLVGGWHRAVYDIWMERLADLKPVMYTGSESQPQKRRAYEAFVRGETNIMVMSLRSGAGIDGLQKAASHVVFGELDWSPQVHVQFTGRLLRTGQERPVTAHYLHVDGGSDPVLMSTLGLKASQSHGILNPYGGMSEATPIDESRIKQLAKDVLERSERG